MNLTNLIGKFSNSFYSSLDLPLFGSSLCLSFLMWILSCSQEASSSSGDVEFLKESGVATSRAKKEVERDPSPPVAAHSGHNSSSSPHVGEHRMVARMTVQQTSSESLEDHVSIAFLLFSVAVSISMI